MSQNYWKNTNKNSNKPNSRDTRKMVRGQNTVSTNFTREYTQPTGMDNSVLLNIQNLTYNTTNRNTNPSSPNESYNIRDSNRRAIENYRNGGLERDKSYGKESM